MNKKGNPMLIIFLFLGMFLLMILAVLMVIGSSVVNWTLDETVPELMNLGQVGDVNMTEVASVTIQPLNTFLQQMTWMTGLVYVFGLISLLGLAFVYRFSGQRWLIPFFFVCVVLVVVAGIFISNIYEDFYDDPSNDLSFRLKEHILLSNMILYSPLIMMIISFIAGIIMFSGSGGDFT